MPESILPDLPSLPGEPPRSSSTQSSSARPQGVGFQQPSPALDPAQELGDPGEGGPLIWIILAGIGVGVAFLGMPFEVAAIEIGLPLLIVGGIVLSVVGWLSRGDRFRRAVRWWTETLDNYGGGFYGLVALLVFTLLEIRGLWIALGQYDSVRAFLDGEGWESLYGFGAASIENFVVAIAWPWRGWEALGGHLVWMVAVGWLLYRSIAALLVPHEPPEAREATEGDTPNDESVVTRA